MEEKKKKFITPNVEIVDFSGDDIVTASVYGDTPEWYLEETDGDEF
jgi:hypothetical protein